MAKKNSAGGSKSGYLGLRKYYDPFPRQREFHNSGAKYRLFGGAAGAFHRRGCLADIGGRNLLAAKEGAENRGPKRDGGLERRLGGLLRLFRHRHPRWAGMRVSMGGLTVWSFLMATAHGAGLMVVPVFMGMSMSVAGEHAHHMPVVGADAGAAFFATGLHAVGYLAVTAFIAMLVFEKPGVGILRRA